MEFQGVSSTFAAKLKTAVSYYSDSLFPEKLKLFNPWQVS